MDNTALLDAFEAGEIAGNEFPHRSYVRVAWELSHRYGPEEGLRRLIAGTQGIAARAGKPTVYHERIRFAQSRDPRWRFAAMLKSRICANRGGVGPALRSWAS